VSNANEYIKIDLKWILGVYGLLAIIILMASTGSALAPSTISMPIVEPTPTPIAVAIPTLIVTPTSTPTASPTSEPLQTPTPAPFVIFPSNYTPSDVTLEQIEEIVVIARESQRYVISGAGYETKEGRPVCHDYSMELVWRLRNRGYDARMVISGLKMDVPTNPLPDWYYSRVHDRYDGYYPHGIVEIAFENRTFFIYVEATTGSIITVEQFEDNYRFINYWKEGYYVWDYHPDRWDHSWR